MNLFWQCHLLFVGVIVMLVVAQAWTADDAQAAAASASSSNPASTPASQAATRPAAPPIVSPQVQADGRVTFRIKAPAAKDVQLRCETLKGAVMRKDENGVWSFTTEPMAPDIYAYSFAVDGVRTLDGANPLITYNLLSSSSQLFVHGPASLLWEVNDVPRGQLHRHFYKSAAAEDQRDFYVYTPPGYDPAGAKRYPVLYLLHGYSDDASAWTCAGYAHVILDNLNARKQAEPMIIVMPLGYGTMDIIKAGWGGAKNRKDLWQTNVSRFRDTLLTEVIPQVEQSYRVAAEPKSRAIAGLSMGGAESLIVGLNALDRFSWIGAFSSGGLGTDYAAMFPTLSEKSNASIRLLWMACGEQDRLLADNQKFSEWLTSKGVRNTWVPTPGEHSFRAWRRYLVEFAPLLFKD